MNRSPHLIAAGFAVIVLASAPRAFAVFGVADTTILSGDLTDVWKWPRELAQWTTLIENTRQQIQKADKLIELTGNPQELVQQVFVESVPELMAPLDAAIGLQNRQDALKFSRELYSLGSVAVQTYDDAKKVGPAYEAFGETVKRDTKRYARYIFQESMNARYKKAVANAQVVEKKEADVQRRALEKLATVKTAAEIAMLNATIDASKARVDLAQQKAAQAKGEMDAFNGELLVEDARKSEADREWASAVVARMRDKALTAYRAQFGTGKDDGGDSL